MSGQATGELTRIIARGTPRDIGRQLGAAGRAAAHHVLLADPLWQELAGPAHRDAVQGMAAGVQARFPAIWEELQGLAEGLDLPLADVLAWQCRGDLLAHAPDGCTTVLLPGPPPVIGHNEDGLPGLRGHAFLAELKPRDAPAILSFCYPGSLPGHTFAVTGAGLVQAVNNMRLRGVRAAIPRIVVGRAVLGCRDLDQAVEVLRRNADCGGFHMALAQAGDARLLSVEYGAGACSVRQVAAPGVHANHALHLPMGSAGQSVTRSSADRQAHGEALLAQGQTDPVVILRDAGAGALPIFRTAPDDPDNETTLATVVFRLQPSGVDWAVRDQGSDRVAHSGHLACG